MFRSNNKTISVVSVVSVARTPGKPFTHSIRLIWHDGNGASAGVSSDIRKTGGID